MSLPDHARETHGVTCAATVRDEAKHCIPSRCCCAFIPGTDEQLIECDFHFNQRQRLREAWLGEKK